MGVLLYAEVFRSSSVKLWILRSMRRKHSYVEAYHYSNVPARNAENFEIVKKKFRTLFNTITKTHPS